MRYGLTTIPNTWEGIDRLQELVEDCSGGPSVLGLDWPADQSMGDDAVSMPRTARQGLAALDRIGHGPCPLGAQGKGWSLRRNYGGRPSAMTCLQAYSTLGLPQALSRDHHPKGHAATE
jgi:hypothetical protein